MKKQTPLLALALGLALNATFMAHAMDNQFTYQGRLTDNSSPATAAYQMQFRLRDGPSDASVVLATMPPQVVSVVDGLFGVAVDFPVVFFDGSDRWLEISVAPPATPTAFAVLLPRQKITPTPYALYAAKAGGLASGVPLTFSDKVTFGPVTGPPFGVLSDVKVENLNSDLLDGLDSGDFWKLTGNVIADGKFLGTINHQPLELKVNGVRALRLEPNAFAPNVIGGHPGNYIAAGIVGATIAGGGYYGVTYPVDDYDVQLLGPDNLNRVTGHWGTVGGGASNHVGEAVGTIAGGWRNFIESGYGASVIGGGQENRIETNSCLCTVAGGGGNIIGPVGYFGTIGGGGENGLGMNAQYSTVSGGEFNAIGSNTLAGFLGGGKWNRIESEVHYSTLSGGNSNRIEAASSFAALGGGLLNIVRSNAVFATLGGGAGNAIGVAASQSVIAGGLANRVESPRATIGGGGGNVIHTNADGATIGGGRNLTVQGNANNATIAGGAANEILFGSSYGTVGGGFGNTVASGYGTVPGGEANSAEGAWGFAAGRRGKARHFGAFVWADSTDADFTSTAVDQFCIRASGGVCLNNATSLSFGNQARQMINLFTTEYGIGVQTDTTYARSKNDFSWFRGGVHNDTRNHPGGGTELMRLTTGGLTVNGAFVSVSDRNAKENFQPVNAREVLAKVAHLPLSRWNFKDDEARSRHLGPMAQDFHAAFSLGADDKHIATVDADGVALAAIQGLYELLKEKDAKINALEQRLASVERAIASASFTAPIQALNVNSGGAR